MRVIINTFCAKCGEDKRGETCAACDFVADLKSKILHAHCNGLPVSGVTLNADEWRMYQAVTFRHAGQTFAGVPIAPE